MGLLASMLLLAERRSSPASASLSSCTVYSAPAAALADRPSARVGRSEGGEPCTPSVAAASLSARRHETRTDAASRDQSGPRSTSVSAPLVHTADAPPLRAPTPVYVPGVSSGLVAPPLAGLIIAGLIAAGLIAGLNVGPRGAASRPRAICGERDGAGRATPASALGRRLDSPPLGPKLVIGIDSGARSRERPNRDALGLVLNLLVLADGSKSPRQIF